MRVNFETDKMEELIKWIIRWHAFSLHEIKAQFELNLSVP